MASPEADIQDIRVGEQLGNGSNGMVWRADLGGRQVAAKEHCAVRDPELYGLGDAAACEGLAKLLQREVDLLSRLKHPNIVEFVGVVWKEIHGVRLPHYICTALAAGTLHDEIYSGSAAAFVEPFFLDIARGLQYLHSERIVHRDVKPTNILLSRDVKPADSIFNTTGQLQLCDVGEARPLDTLLRRPGTRAGTGAYHPPEGPDNSFGQDIFATGVTLVEMILGEAPSMDPAERRAQIRRAAQDRPHMASSIHGCTTEQRRRFLLFAGRMTSDELLAAAMQSALVVLPKLDNFTFRALYGHGSLRDLSGRELRSLLGNCRGLQQVDLHHCTNLTDAAVKILAENCRGLQEVIFWGCERLTNVAMRHLAQNCRGLQQVDFSLCKHLTDAAVRHLAENCRGLQQVGFVFCGGITVGAVRSLEEAIPGVQVFT